MGSLQLFSVILLVSLVSSISADPTPEVSQENNKQRGMFDMFGFSKPAQVDQNYAMGNTPCYQPTTTTPAPLGPLCPLQPLDGAQGRPFDARPPYQWSPFQQWPNPPAPPAYPDYPQPPPAPAAPAPPAYPAQPAYPAAPPVPAPPPYPEQPPVPGAPPVPAPPPYPAQPAYPGAPPVPAPPPYPEQPPIPSAPQPPAPPPYPEQPAVPGAPPVPAPPPYPAQPAYPGAPPVPAPPPYPEQPPVPAAPPVPAPPPYPQVPPAPAVPNAPPLPPTPAVPPVPNPNPSPSVIHGHFFPGDPPYQLPGQAGFFVPAHGQFVPDQSGGYQPASSIPQPSLVLPNRPTLMDPGFSVVPTNPLLQPTCAGIPVGPLIPPGFWIVNSLLRQQYYANQAYPTSGNLPLCNMVDVLQQLRLVTIFTLIQQAGLEQLFTQTSNYTFFAPVDPAFEKLPAWFLQSLRDDIKLLRAFIMNHFIKIEVELESLGNEFLIMNARSGGNRLRINVYNQESDYRTYTVDGARMLIGDINTYNGILHVTDKVLVPTKVRLHSEYLAEVQDFSVFLSAVVDSGLLPFLEDKNSPVTLFLPYNEAFKGFDYNAIANDIQALQNLVNYHMVNGTFYSNGLVNGQYLTTNYYKEIKISVSSDGFSRYATMLNGYIKILKADIPVVNGVVHIIDTVLTYDLNFLTNIEMSEFNMEFGTLRRTMALNKHELEKEFAHDVSHKLEMNDTRTIL